MKLSTNAQIFWYSQTYHPDARVLCGRCLALCPGEAITTVICFTSKGVRNMDAAVTTR